MAAWSAPAGEPGRPGGQAQDPETWKKTDKSGPRGWVDSGGAGRSRADQFLAPCCIDIPTCSPFSIDKSMLFRLFRTFSPFPGRGLATGLVGLGRRRAEPRGSVFRTLPHRDSHVFAFFH